MKQKLVVVLLTVLILLGVLPGTSVNAQDDFSLVADIWLAAFSLSATSSLTAAYAAFRKGRKEDE